MIGEMSDEHTFEIESLDPDLLNQPIAAGRTAEVYDSGDGWVVKLFAFGIGREAAFNELDALKTAQLHGIPVPEPGDLVLMMMRWGFAMKKVEGKNGMQRLHAGQDPVEAGRLYAGLQHDLTSHSGKFLPQTDQVVEEKIGRLDGFSDEEKGKLLALLRKAPKGDRLLHGDYHPGNVLWREEGGHVFTDWVDASKGHPSADVARSLVLFGYGTEGGSDPSRAAFTEAYLTEWEKLSKGIREEALAWLPLCRAVRLLESAESSQDELATLVKMSL